MQHGSKYSHRDVAQIRADVNQMGEPMSVQLPKTVSRHSSQSLKVDSVEVSPPKLSNQNGSLPMATISNHHKHEAESMGNMYDQK